MVAPVLPQIMQRQSACACLRDPAQRRYSSSICCMPCMLAVMQVCGTLC
jgi:hypothetical protein